VEAYETRVAESEKKKLMAPMMIDEELKSKVVTSKREWGASWWTQYSILFWRGLKERRHDYFSWLRITQVVATAVILGMLWWQSGGDSPKHMQEQVFDIYTQYNFPTNGVQLTILQCMVLKKLTETFTKPL